MAHLSSFNYDEYSIEHAISFLADNLKKSGHNSKPVLLHSIRVGELLWERGAPENTVIAGVLHDILEDTKINYVDLEKEFGHIVSELVDSLTFDSKELKEEDKLMRSKVSFDKSKRLGVDSLIIRSCDLVDNSYYYSKSTDPLLSKYLYEKFYYFMNLVKPVLIETPYWQILNKSFNEHVKILID